MKNRSLNEKDSDLDLVFYTGESKPTDPGLMVLTPEFATTVHTDQDGKFLLEIVLGEDIPFGCYKLAYGEGNDVSLISLNLSFCYWEER